MRIRLAIIISIFILLYSLLIGKLYNLQIKKGEFYSVRAESQLKLAGLLEPVRGNIYFTDKRGSDIPAAMNKDFPFVFAVPKEVEDPPEAAAFFAPLIGKPADFLAPLLAQKNDQYEPLLSKASDEQVTLIKNANLKGIYVDEEPARFYPLDNLGSQIIGFVSTSDSADNRPIGQYGIERFYNKILTGAEGNLKGDAIVKSTPGEDIKLTIDRNIQSKAEEIIKKLIAEYRAPAGSFIVLDPKTGKILAMGGAPDYNPNAYGQSDIKTFLNPTIQEVYEPGSVVKVLTMSAGLDAGAITPETAFYDSGFLTLNQKTIKNFDNKAYGTVDMSGIIEHSINTGAAFVERKLGHKNFYSYLVKFGLKNITGVDLPGERLGSLTPLEKNPRDINFATASFGQGVSMTPLRLITSIGAIANRGIMMRPYLNDSLRPEELGKPISAATADKVIKMMVSAVDKALVAKIDGYTVAGKTGTAQVPNFVRGGYTDDVINTYVGFAPASDPKFIVLIKMDKPAGGLLAGMTVVPAFRELSEFILSYYNITPDRIGK